jgi:hypothetical protein
MMTHHVSNRQRLKEAEQKIQELLTRIAPAQFSDPLQSLGQTLQQPQLLLGQSHPCPSPSASSSSSPSSNSLAQQQLWQPAGPPPSQQQPQVQLLAQPPAGQLLDPRALSARWQADLRNGLMAQQSTQRQTTVLSQDAGVASGAEARALTGAQGTMLS